MVVDPAYFPYWVTYLTMKCLIIDVCSSWQSNFYLSSIIVQNHSTDVHISHGSRRALGTLTPEVQSKFGARGGPGESHVYGCTNMMSCACTHVFCLFICLFAQYGFTPLIRACSTGKRELVELYLDKGADVNKPAYVCT